MSLNPEDRKDWQGFLDLLQPPSGYKLAAAIGSTFGLSMDALTAALLSMAGADGEEVTPNPIAATMAIEQMRSKVRVLVHPATTKGPALNVGSNRFIAMLDRFIVEIQPQRGLFHPKLWALRFDRLGHPRTGEPRRIGRLIVGSRNLSPSTAFELGAVFEGSEIDEAPAANSLSADAAKALREWMTATDVHYPEAVWQLPQFIRRIAFESPIEAENGLRLLWQGLNKGGMSEILPARMNRALLVSPFIQPDFVRDLLDRTNEIVIVSLPESLDGLPDETIAALDTRAKEQGSQVLFQVSGHGDPNDAYIEGVHAKLLMTETRHDQMTFVGSANATGPGWGLSAPPNVEAMIEMRPGVGIDRFTRSFIRENKSTLHPWVSFYDRKLKAEDDELRDAERHLLAALREVAKLELVLNYQQKSERLSLFKRSRKRLLPDWVSRHGAVFSLAPLLLADTTASWRKLTDLDGGDVVFENVPISKLSGFVVLRAKCSKPSLEAQRIVVAKLEAGDALLDERDRILRADIMETADPALVLSALIRGLASIPSMESQKNHRGKAGAGQYRDLFADTTLERLLQAVAIDPEIIEQMRVLLGSRQDALLQRLCEDLAAVVQPGHEDAYL